MLENPRLCTVKLKNASKQPSRFGIYLKKELKFSKKFSNFIDLGSHFDLCENESYSTFVAKLDSFKRKNISNY